MSILRNTSSWFLLIALILASMVNSIPSYADSTSLVVTEVSRPPNYGQTTDSDDLIQLTNGVTVGFPLWTKREAVGWTQASPIVLSIDVRGKSSQSKVPHQGTIRIHTAKGTYAGVDVPRHIDVYARGAEAKYYKVGSVSPLTEQYADRANHWIAIPLSMTTDHLLVVLHASGDFLFLDEVEYQDQGETTITNAASPIDTKEEALANSISNLRELLLSRTSRGIKLDESYLGTSEIMLWAQDPWSDRMTGVPDQKSSQMAKSFVVEGMQGEHESACIGLIPRMGLHGQTVKVKVSGIPEKTVQILQLQPILVANGQVAYDPLVPLGPANTLMLEKSAAHYVWLSFNLSQISIGTHHISISFATTDGRELALMSGDVEVKAPPKQAGIKPSAINWGYLRDVPIWKNPDVAFRDLLKHGINVFVLHPADIPGLSLDGSWNIQQSRTFSKTVELVRGNGMLLLYLGWNAGKNPLKITSGDPNLTPEVRKRLRQWLDKMSTYLTSQGFKNIQWALYPVDEPRGVDLEFLENVANAIKDERPEIQIYANPTYGESGRTTIANLLPLKNLVDIWQPNLRLVREGGDIFFREQQKAWWLYHNPNSPAKLGSPLHDYRLLSWWAWFYGAKGVGFWSYSDTDGSSAWNDLDGRYPDWAVVYEGNNAVVSSRRWEAFREGLEDYYLLSLLDSQAAESIQQSYSYTTSPRSANFDAWSSQDLIRARHNLLQYVH